MSVIGIIGLVGRPKMPFLGVADRVLRLLQVLGDRFSDVGIPSRVLLDCKILKRLSIKPFRGRKSRWVVNTRVKTYKDRKKRMLILNIAAGITAGQISCPAGSANGFWRI